MREWFFDTYFSGTIKYVRPLDETEEDVRKLAEEAFYGGNWKRDTLRPGKKVKVKR